jgi:hypothetical protein
VAGGGDPSEDAVGLGLDCQHIGDDWPGVGEVEAVAGADLQHPAGQVSEQGAAVLDGVLDSMAGAGPGIDASEDRVLLAGRSERKMGNYLLNR